MKVEIREKNSCTKELEIEVPIEIVNREYDNAYNALNKKVKISGFRKGKAPRKVLARHYKDSIESDVLQRLITDSYLKAIKENNINALGQPKIDNVELEINKPLHYTAIVETLPEISISNYKGLEFTKKVVKVSKKDVDEGLQRLREQTAKYEGDDRKPIEKFDYIIISYERYIDDVLDEGESKKNLPLTVGYQMIYPEIEQELIGMKKGEEKEIKINFPEDYRDKKIAGKEVKFKVGINEVKKRILPDMNDEFAKEIGECDNLAQLRDRIKKEMEEFEQGRAKSHLKREIIDKLIELNEVEVPQILVEEQMHLMFYDTQQRLKAQGVKLDDAAIELKKIRETLKEPAEMEVKGFLIIDKIAEAESIDVSHEEVEKRVKEIAESMNQNYTAFRQRMINNKGFDKLRNKMKRDNTLDFLINISTIKEEMVEREEVSKENSKGEDTNL